MSENKKVKFRKKLIIIFVIVIVTLLLMYGLTVAIPYFYTKFIPEKTEYIENFNFYTPDYSEDIFEDEEYLARIVNGILEYDNNSNSITMVDLTNANAHGEQVELLVKMMYSVINGNNVEYNSYFSQKYSKENLPKDKFTMQKVYNGRITYFSTETVTVDDVTYNEYTYTLKYQIYENNGTFRKDIGDGCRVQYITISDREGKFLIDSITYPRYK